MSRHAQVWIDTGGTFTDGMAIDAAGELQRAKVLSTSALRGTVRRPLSATEFEIQQRWGAPVDFVRGFSFRLLGRPETAKPVAAFDPSRRLLTLAEPLEAPVQRDAPFEVLSPEEAPLLAARLLTGTPLDRPLPSITMRLATTLGTNMLLERGGVPTALFITRGFGDLLLIGDQQRPELFTLKVRKPEPLYASVVEVPERVAADGTVLEALDLEALAPRIDELVAAGVQVAAVALLHGYRNPGHERELRDRLQQRGFEHVSCSSDLAPTIKLLPRAQTAVVDAYLAPVIRAYLDRVGQGIASGESGPDAPDDTVGRLHVMTSAGGLVSPAAFRPKDSLLSGPAGGVVGAAVAGRQAGFDRVLVFDMGGTSTDTARFDGDYEYEFEHRVGDARLVAPALSIESVAAGGGSICSFDGHRLRVGPKSAGADPGPACYGAGGPLTLTDVNLLSGLLSPGRFRIPIDTAAATAKLLGLRDKLKQATGDRVQTQSLLEGLRAIANERMADAIRSVSLRKGYDPADYALVAFGGAGGQHACGVASRLGVRTVVVPPDAGLLSALGLGHAVLERFAERQVLRPLADAEPELEALLGRLDREAIDAVSAEGVPAESIEVRRRLAHLRFVGQDSTVEVEIEPGAALQPRFERRYQELFGHRPEGRAVELESLRVVASSTVAGAGVSLEEDRQAEPPRSVPVADVSGPREETEATGKGRTEAPTAELRRAWFEGGWSTVPVFDRERLKPGATFGGPALVFEPHGTTVVEPGWSCEVDVRRMLILRRHDDETPPGGRRLGHPPTTDEHPEAVRLELFTHRFRTIAGEMGDRLRQTAISTNVKERMDFSCALLDADGRLVVNAPHIPVHLGAIGLCVRELKRRVALEPGDVVVTNHPAFGGSHLPDVTVVTPVHAAPRGEDAEGSAHGELLGYVASRAHHAEIGGARPGSMPPAATRLVEEGVVIPPTHLVRGGVADWDTMRTLLQSGPHPTRALEDNLADLRAAVAANHAGVRALRRMSAEHGVETVRHYMSRLKRLAEERMQEALSRIPDGVYRATEHLDDGTPLSVTIRLKQGSASIDFQETGATHPGNLNATPAIVQSAVIYVLRLLIRQPLPLNEGLLAPVTIDVPPGTLLNPGFPDDPEQAPAVVGGNVETSQRLVDTLIKALGLAACSQGTMNNVIFGNERFGYYETVCGGCGAGPDFDGADAVHSHMTNTRITDPEILEYRFPVRVERFAVREGSGGAGRHRGGNGVIRELSFLDDVELSVLSQHRSVRPYGLNGGEPGQAGSQCVVASDGAVDELGAVDERDVRVGQRFVLRTPGGGGFGKPGS